MPGSRQISAEKGLCHDRLASFLDCRAEGQPPRGPPAPLPVAPPAQPKDPVGLYGFANAAYKDRDNELRSHCGDFTRKNAVGDFNELCSSVGRHCQWVCDWEGHAKACGENPNDGTRLAMCQ